MNQLRSQWTAFHFNNNTLTTYQPRIKKEDYGRSLVISNLEKGDKGAYLVFFKISGVVQGSKSVNLEVIERIVATGDVYDYATVQGSYSLMCDFLIFQPYFE